MSSAESMFTSIPISYEHEMGAYEALWSISKTTFKKLADLFKNHPGITPSQLVSQQDVAYILPMVHQKIKEANIKQYGIRFYGTLDYPDCLRDAKHPIELLYYRGNWDLIYSPKKIALVGTRHPTTDGLLRTQKLTKLLVKEGYVIVSGLAKGIDTMAHKTAIDCAGRTIAVIGTPITTCYPKENKVLQETIANEHLLISQVPIVRYYRQNYRSNRFFFPERNITMSAISDATIIVEASETSGTLTQAQAALEQNRKLFILESCFLNPALTWPNRFLEKGAIRVKHIDDILNVLK